MPPMNSMLARLQRDSDIYKEMQILCNSQKNRSKCIGAGYVISAIWNETVI